MKLKPINNPTKIILAKCSFKVNFFYSDFTLLGNYVFFLNLYMLLQKQLTEYFRIVRNQKTVKQPSGSMIQLKRFLENNNAYYPAPCFASIPCGIPSMFFRLPRNYVPVSGFSGLPRNYVPVSGFSGLQRKFIKVKGIQMNVNNQQFNKSTFLNCYNSKKEQNSLFGTSTKKITQSTKLTPLFPASYYTKSSYFTQPVLIQKEKRRVKSFNSFSSFSSFSILNNLVEPTLSDMDGVIIDQTLVKKLKNFNRNAVAHLYGDSQKTHLTLERQEFFAETIKWLFSFHYGYLLENVLTTKLKKKPIFLLLFKTDFLNYQGLPEHKIFFERKQTIGQYELPIVKIIFNKANLLKIIRLIMSTYNNFIWDLLSPRQKYYFCKQLIDYTLKSGSYAYINCLFNDISNNQIIYSQNQIFSLIINQQPIILPVKITEQHQISLNNKKNNKYIKNLIKNKFPLGLGVLLGVGFIACGRFLSGGFGNSLDYGFRQLTTVANIGENSYRSYPPFAMMTSNPLLTKVQPINQKQGRSREVIKAIKAHPLASKNRQVVTLYTPPISSQAFMQGAGEENNIPVFAQWQDEDGNYQFKKIVTKLQISTVQTFEMNETSIATLLTTNNTPLLQELCETTPLGTKVEGFNEVQRNLHVDLIIIDPTCQTKVDWVVMTNYKEAGGVGDYVEEKLIESYLALALSDSKQDKDLLSLQKEKIYKKVVSFTKKKSLSMEDLKNPKKLKEILAEFKQSFPPGDLETLLDVKKGASYNAAHMLSKKICDNLGLDHADLMTIHSTRYVNGPASYDNPVLTLLNFIGQTSFSDVLTAKLNEAHVKAWESVTKKLLEKGLKDCNNIGMVLLLEDAKTCYKVARNFMGMVVTNEAIQPYTTNPNFDTNVLQVFAPKLGLIKAILDTSINNVSIVNNHASSFLKDLKTPIYSQDNNPQTSIFQNTEDCEKDNEKINKKVQTLALEYHGGGESIKGFKTLGTVRAIYHGLLSGKPYSDLEDLLKKNELMLTKRGNIQTANVKPADGLFLEDSETYGQRLGAKYDEAVFNLQNIKKYFEREKNSIEDMLKNQQDHIVKENGRKRINYFEAWIKEITTIQNNFTNCYVNQNELAVSLSTQLSFQSQTVKNSLFSNEIRYNNIIQLVINSSNSNNPKKELAELERALTCAFDENQFYKNQLIELNPFISNGLSEQSVFVNKKSNEIKAMVANLSEKISGELSGDESETSTPKKRGRKPKTQEGPSTTEKQELPTLSQNLRQLKLPPSTMLLEQSQMEAIGSTIMGGARQITLGSDAREYNPSPRVNRLVSTGNTFSPKKQESPVAFLALPPSGNTLEVTPEEGSPIKKTASPRKKETSPRKKETNPPKKT